MNEWMNENDPHLHPIGALKSVGLTFILLTNCRSKISVKKRTVPEPKTFRSPSCNWFWDNTMTTYIAITLSEHCVVTLLVKETNKRKLCYPKFSVVSHGVSWACLQEPEYLQGSCTTKITLASVREHSRRLLSRRFPIQLSVSSLPSLQQLLFAYGTLGLCPVDLTTLGATWLSLANLPP